MLNQVFLRVYELAHGKALPVVLEDVTNVSQRTWRKPAAQMAERTFVRAGKNATNDLRARLKRSGHSEDECDAWLAAHPAMQGPGRLCSGLVYEAQADGMHFPHTLEYARRIDQWSTHLFHSRQDNDLSAFKQALNAGLRELGLFDDGITKGGFDPHVVERISTATTWDAIDKPVQDGVAGATLSLLAHWDVEFCSVYFTSFSARPCFSLLLPAIDPAARPSEGRVARRRDMFWYPVRRLINLLACLGAFVQAHRWPEKVPSVEQTDRHADLPLRTLVTWRNGTRPLTARHFADLWYRLSQVRQGPRCEGDCTVPWPLYVAAVIWQDLLVGVEKKKWVLLIEDEYLPWWHTHLASLKAKGCTFGTSPWPSCFDGI